MKNYTRNDKKCEKRVKNAINKRIKNVKSHQPINALYNIFQKPLHFVFNYVNIIKVIMLV